MKNLLHVTLGKTIGIFKRMNDYPTKEEIENAPLSKLSQWFVLLPNPIKDEHQEIIDQIRNRIHELYKGVK